MIELATGRSLAVSAARDDTRILGFPAFKVADAKHTPPTTFASLRRGKQGGGYRAIS